MELAQFPRGIRSNGKISFKRRFFACPSRARFHVAFQCVGERTFFISFVIVPAFAEPYIQGFFCEHHRFDSAHLAYL
ncbi:hypothetical protein XalbCFBP2523_03045 [Xanthomonas albilineans]|nr:hypothetical protein XalbCFBP2523_03045 [Xanthomonas albilineans]